MATITPDTAAPVGNTFGGATVGETPTPFTPSASGDSIALVGEKVTVVFVTATSNTPTVTVDSVTPSDQGNDNNLTLALPASGIRRIVFDATQTRFKQVSGNVGYVNLTYSVTPTGTTMYAWSTN